MNRRNFLIGLGSTPVGGSTLIGASSANGADPPGNRNEPEEPVENTITGETYNSVGAAVDEAEPGHTLLVELGATFDENITIHQEDVTLKAKGDSRLRFDRGTDIETLEADGNSKPAVDGGQLLLLEARGNSEPTVEGDVETLVLEARGNSKPTIEGDVERLILETKGNAETTVKGDVEEAVLDERGNPEVNIEGEISEITHSARDAQPRIDGEVEIEANGVTLEGFDIAAETVGIDVRAENPETVQLSNNVISGARDESGDDSVPPEDGAGIRVTTPATSGPITIGGEKGANILVDNAIGIKATNRDGSVADVDAIPLLKNNRFVRNGIGVVPKPGDPKEEPDPIVSPEPPVEVLTSKREPGDAITAELPDVTVDEEEAIKALSVSVRLESETSIELTFDPQQSVDDPTLVDGYEAISDGAFAIDTPLNEDDIEAVRFTFSIERDLLDDPEVFTVHRQAGGEFEPLRTELVAETPTTYQYAVLSPGFSIFQMAEFDVGGIGGPGREIMGDIKLPDDDPVDDTFVRVEATEAIDSLELEAQDSRVAIDDSVLIDLEDFSEKELPQTFVDLFRITNVGDEPTTVRTSAGLSRATFLNVQPDIDLDGVVGSLLPWGAFGRFADIVTDPIELNPGETVSLALSLSSTDPDNQLWVNLKVPTLTDGNTGGAYFGSEDGIPRNIHCANEVDAPVMFQRYHDIGDDARGRFNFRGGPPDWVPNDANTDNPHLRVPAYLDVNWHGESLDRDDEEIAISIELNDGPDGSLVAIYDEEGEINSSDTHYTSDRVGLGRFSAEDFAGGAVSIEFDLIFESHNDCDMDQSDLVNDYVGELEINVHLIGEDNRWAEIAEEDEVSTTARYYTRGESLIEISNELLDEAFQTLVEGVINAVQPGPVMTYRVIRGLRGKDPNSGKLLEVAAIWEGLDEQEHPDLALTPQSLLADPVAAGIVGFSGDNEGRLPPDLEVQGLDVGLFGPSIYISDDPEPDCVDPDVRTLSVEGQVTGGPVVLMGLDSELRPGSSSHGPPEDHAALVESILDSVTNDGEGILVLGGDPNRNRDIEDYWVGDVAEDPSVDEEVTFVNGANDIREVDFEGYAMIGIVSSTGQISNGLVNSENEALIDRQGDLAAFINGGGGLLGKTQDRLSDPWEYISPVADIEPISASNSSIIVTDAGVELGLTQDGMDACCYHEGFDEESVPDFLDVILRNPEQSGNPPAAVGGNEVVVQTAIDLEITGPANVEVGEPTEFEFSLENAAAEAGEDIRLEVEFTRIDEIEADDIELSNGSELELEDDALTGTLTEEPIEFPPDLDKEFTRELTLNDTGTYYVQIDVVGNESGETVVQLPFGIRSVGEAQGICED